MPLNQITPNFFASPQLTLADLPLLVDKGIKTLIVNRPDGEGGADQPHSDEMREAASALGITTHYFPMAPGQLNTDLVEVTLNVLGTAEGPVCAYCASGTRSTLIWCFANVKDIGLDETLKAAKSGGYDFTSLRPALSKFAQG